MTNSSTGIFQTDVPDGTYTRKVEVEDHFLYTDTKDIVDSLQMDFQIIKDLGNISTYHPNILNVVKTLTATLDGIVDPEIERWNDSHVPIPLFANRAEIPSNLVQYLESALYDIITKSDGKVQYNEVTSDLEAGITFIYATDAEMSAPASGYTQYDSHFSDGSPKHITIFIARDLDADAYDGTFRRELMRAMPTFAYSQDPNFIMAFSTTVNVTSLNPDEGKALQIMYTLNHNTDMRGHKEIVINEVIRLKNVFLNTKIFLQGNYSSGSMSTSLNSDGQLPILQPFNQLPWSYDGSEIVSSIPLNVVDWVLVELRTSTDANSMVARRAGFLRSDGYIMDLDGVDALESENVDPGLYYIVVYHRNHLPVMSSETYEVVDKSCPGIPALEYGGKIYHTVQIGDQCWLRENLDIGTMIQGNEEQTDNSIIEKYCYDNLESNCEIYGGLYQWSEAMQYDSTEAVKGICPDGWHIPSYSDLNTLIDAVSGNGNELKAVGQDSIDVSGTNISGFSAILVGYRGITGNFYFLENSTDFWSSSKRFTFDAYSMTLIFNNTNIDLNTFSRKRGVSIRCIKD